MTLDARPTSSCSTHGLRRHARRTARAVVLDDERHPAATLRSELRQGYAHGDRAPSAACSSTPTDADGSPPCLIVPRARSSRQHPEPRRTSGAHPPLHWALILRCPARVESDRADAADPVEARRATSSLRKRMCRSGSKSESPCPALLVRSASSRVPRPVAQFGSPGMGFGSVRVWGAQCPVAAAGRGALGRAGRGVHGVPPFPLTPGYAAAASM